MMISMTTKLWSFQFWWQTGHELAILMSLHSIIIMFNYGCQPRFYLEMADLSCSKVDLLSTFKCAMILSLWMIDARSSISMRAKNPQLWVQYFVFVGTIKTRKKSTKKFFLLVSARNFELILFALPWSQKSMMKLAFLGNITYLGFVCKYKNP